VNQRLKCDANAPVDGQYDTKGAIAVAAEWTAAEALAWIDEAANLLDQAHSNLRTVGMEYLEGGDGLQRGRCHIKQLRIDVESLAATIRRNLKEGE
jgi:hypothetical protein